MKEKIKEGIYMHKLFGKSFIIWNKGDYKYLFKENGDFVRLFYNASDEAVEEFAINNL